MNFIRRFFKGLSLIVFILAVVSCKDSKSKTASYPNGFPQECIDYLDKWARYIEKAKTSKRFDKEAIAAFETNRRVVIYAIDKVLTKEDGEGNDDREGYCKLEEQYWSFFKPIDDMNNMTQDELEKAMHLDERKQLARESRILYNVK